MGEWVGSLGVVNQSAFVMEAVLGDQAGRDHPLLAALSAASQHQGCLLPSHRQVGLRPGRPSVRLELEQVALKQQQPGGSSGKSSLPVVHNYGHGRRRPHASMGMRGRRSAAGAAGARAAVMPAGTLSFAQPSFALLPDMLCNSNCCPAAAQGQAAR